MPLRALSEFNQTIRSLAKVEGLYLIDVDSVFTRHAADGLVGFSLIGDNAHPTPLGNAIIAREIVRTMNAHHLFVEQDLGHWNLTDQLDYFLTQSIGPENRRALEKEYLIRYAKYSMKVPHYNFTASRMYLEQAVALDSSDWTIWANLATLSLWEDRIEQGRKELRKAIKLRGRWIDPEEREHTPHLKEAIEHTGLTIEDLQ